VQTPARGPCGEEPRLRRRFRLHPNSGSLRPAGGRGRSGGHHEAANGRQARSPLNRSRAVLQSRGLGTRHPCRRRRREELCRLAAADSHVSERRLSREATLGVVDGISSKGRRRGGIPAAICRPCNLRKADRDYLHINP